ncbi:MAG: hypothetical protein M3O55_00710 [Actinomycetota bacterium]|nr:hypothetical protein [Actinomycetota bacterium]
MVQPYLGRVADEGDTSVIYLGGAFSHGARKAQLLADVIAAAAVDSRESGPRVAR